MNSLLNETMELLLTSLGNIIALWLCKKMTTFFIASFCDMLRYMKQVWQNLENCQFWAVGVKGSILLFSLCMCMFESFHNNTYLLANPHNNSKL